jgi:hypothetical protein
VKVSVEQLIREYWDDKTTADMMYSGKLALITGFYETHGSIGMTQGNISMTCPTLTLITSPTRSVEQGFIVCEFGSADTAKKLGLDQYGKGQLVTVQGEIVRPVFFKLFWVEIRGCTLRR